VVVMSVATVELLTPKEACRILNISYMTLRRWVKTGKINYVKTPAGRILIPRDEIEKILKH